jgi:hypothetical protein
MRRNSAAIPAIPSFILAQDVSRARRSDARRTASRSGRFRISVAACGGEFQARPKTRIVAIGSSSTAGADGILPFPPRLEMTLREKFYGEWATRFIALALSRAIVGASQAVAWARWPSRRIAKICRSFVKGYQRSPGYSWTLFNPTAGDITMRYLPDHGLPLVQLKEQRRDLIVALQNRNGPVNGWELMQIATIQQAISAFEEVIADLDAEMEAAA